MFTFPTYRLVTGLPPGKIEASIFLYSAGKTTEVLEVFFLKGYKGLTYNRHYGDRAIRIAVACELP